MRAVFLKNPVSFWQIDRRLPDEIRTAGMFAFLPLNIEGEAALKAGLLNRREPQLEYVAAAGEIPAAMYGWAVVARRFGKIANAVMRRALGPAYLEVPWYAMPATKGGIKSVTDSGLSPPDGGGNAIGSMAQLTEKAAAPERAPDIAVEVASSAEHLQMSAFIRGATFGAEQACPYYEEFDGNDFCSMHLIGFVDDAPVATLRVRFFAEFAKLERLAVLEGFRKTQIKHMVMHRAIDICHKKGYTRIYGQSQERLVGFYAKFGFKPLKKNRRLVFSDHNYIEIVRDLDRHPAGISIDSDPYLIIRPEGRWEREGVLEKSAVRPATNPHAGQRDSELQTVAP